MYISPTAVRDLFVGSYRERADKDAASGTLIMKLSRVHRRLAWFTLAATLVTLTLFIAKLGIDPTSWWWFASLLCSMLILGSAAFLLSMRRRIYLSTDGIVSRPPLGRETSIAWSDITAVRFRQWGWTLRIHTKQGVTIVIPSAMSGGKDLEEMMDRRLPVQVYAMAFMKYRAALKQL
jgi:hypothetical protein